MDEPSLPVEAAFQENPMEMGIPSRELARRRRGDHGGALDLSAGCRMVEALDHAVDELAELAVEPPIVTEENAEHLGKSKDYLPVWEKEQQPFIYVLPE